MATPCDPRYERRVVAHHEAHDSRHGRPEDPRHFPRPEVPRGENEKPRTGPVDTFECRDTIPEPAILRQGYPSTISNKLQPPFIWRIWREKVVVNLNG